MSENNLEGEQRDQCKEAQFVDDKRAELIQRVTSVMPIADELKSKNMLHEEKYDEIKQEKTNQEKMRKLFESLKSGGDKVKIAFYKLLEKHERLLFEDLGGVCRKRKLADPESPVPCKRLNTESNEQVNPNFNNASTSAQKPAPTYTTVYNIVQHNERPPPYDMGNNSIVPKTECKTPERELKKEKKPPAPKKEKKSPTPKKEKKPPAPKKEKKPPVRKVKKTPAPKKEKKPPVRKVKKTPAPKKEKKPPVRKVKKTPAPKKEKKPPVRKVKKTPAPKKEKKPPVRKVKKTPAPKKAKKPAGRK